MRMSAKASSAPIGSPVYVRVIIFPSFSMVFVSPIFMSKSSGIVFSVCVPDERSIGTTDIVSAFCIRRSSPSFTSGELNSRKQCCTGICVLFSIIAAVFSRTSLLFLFLLPCPISKMPRFCMVCFLFFIVSKGFFCHINTNTQIYLSHSFSTQWKQQESTINNLS